MTQHTLAELERALQGDDLPGAGPDLATIRTRRGHPPAPPRAGPSARPRSRPCCCWERSPAACGERTPRATARGAAGVATARAVAPRRTGPGRRARRRAGVGLAGRAPGSGVATAWPSGCATSSPGHTGRDRRPPLRRGDGVRRGRLAVLALPQGVAAIEQDMGDGDSHPVGSTDMGIPVDTGQAYLGCGRTVRGPAWRCLPDPRRPWLGLRVGMGTEGFLRPGSDMEVSSPTTTRPASPVGWSPLGCPAPTSRRWSRDDRRDPGAGHRRGRLGRAGQHHDVGPGPGRPHAVIAYDSSGEVIEDHELQPCSSPVDCEVRRSPI